MSRHLTWMVLILLAAALLRLVAISQVPPGMTHDEADHGLDAWGVVQGDRPLYFTVGYGREPLFDYTTALIMSFLGPTYLAGRLTAVFFGLLSISATYAWASIAFNRRIALLTAAGLAVSFWAVMTSRQALRSVTFAALFAASAAQYWRGARLVNKDGSDIGSVIGPRLSVLRSGYAAFLGAGLLLGASFYAYIPARIQWILYPALLVLLILFRRREFRRVLPGTLLTMAVAAIVAGPIFVYLATNPGSEIRLSQLSGPLDAALRGDFGTLLQNIAAGLGVLSFNGDTLSRYNIPGKPVLDPLMSVLFYAGIAVAVWWAVRGLRKPATPVTPASAIFALAWLVLGLVPALITGADASTTRIIGAQPVVYLFPAIALALMAERPPFDRYARVLLPLLLYGTVLSFTISDYFFTWANDPEVRVQYESTLVAAVRYVNNSGVEAAAISNPAPNRFHSPATALLFQEDPDMALRWFDGQHALLVPHERQASILFSGFAPLAPELAEYFEAEPAEVLPLRETDLDRPVTVYALDGIDLAEEWESTFDPAMVDDLTAPIGFGDAADLLGYDLQTSSVQPGGEIVLATLWRANQPINEAVIFAQLLGPDGLPAGQEDRLDAPSYYWVPGDLFIQLHRFAVDPSTQAGEYPLVVGMYTRPDISRLMATVDGETVGDHVTLLHVRVGE